MGGFLLDVFVTEHKALESNFHFNVTRKQHSMNQGAIHNIDFFVSKITVASRTSKSLLMFCVATELGDARIMQLNLSEATAAVVRVEVNGKRASPPVLAWGVGCWGTNFTNPSGEVGDESSAGSGEAGGVGAATGRI